MVLRLSLPPAVGRPRVEPLPWRSAWCAAPLFAALGDETRLDLLIPLDAGGPGSITRLSAKSKVTRQAISRHLEVLSEAGLVRSTREGRNRVWKLAPERLTDANEYLDRISGMWDQAIDRLRAFVESGRIVGAAARLVL